MVILPPGFGIKAKRFTEANEGNEAFAPPAFEPRQSPSVASVASVVILPLGLGIKASAPFVSFVSSVNQSPRLSSQGKVVYRS
jgi:hypothetical protein